MEGQLLPAHARLQAAASTATPNAIAARNDTRTMRWAREESRTRDASEESRRAMPQTSRLRGAIPADTIGGYDRSAAHARRPRLHSRRDAGAGGPAPRRPHHRLHRLRPDRALAPRRQSGAGDGAGLAPAVGAHAD